jgi:hypothetical protein
MNVELMLFAAKIKGYTQQLYGVNVCAGKEDVMGKQRRADAEGSGLSWRTV